MDFISKQLNPRWFPEQEKTRECIVQMSSSLPRIEPLGSATELCRLRRELLRQGAADLQNQRNFVCFQCLQVVKLL